MAKKKSIEIPVLRIHQPIGEFFVGVIDSKSLVDISYADIRAMENRLDTYLGIQRRLSPDRVKELKKYVHSIDATFPTSIILAVDGECATWDEKKSTLLLHESNQTPYEKIAKILDGQHRVEGLKEYTEENFQLNVTIFVNADIADQANIFATVNLAQTKVNKSLVYDLFDYAAARSPQKTAHDIVVALDRHEKSPLHHMIKRLGVATEGRRDETITQATVVESLLDQFLSSDSKSDRQLLLKGKSLKKADIAELKKYPFRNLFIEGRDIEITKILLAYFVAVSKRWPIAWASRAKGNILPRTNGIRALLKYLKPAYLHLTTDDSIGEYVSADDFYKLLSKVSLKDKDFNSEIFLPGTSGETALVKKLLEDTGIKN